MLECYIRTHTYIFRIVIGCCKLVERSAKVKASWDICSKKLGLNQGAFVSCVNTKLFPQDLVSAYCILGNFRGKIISLGFPSNLENLTTGIFFILQAITLAISALCVEHLAELAALPCANLLGIVYSQLCMH